MKLPPHDSASNLPFSDLAGIGHALWADPERARRLMIETIGAVALLDLDQERALERVSAALFQRALSDVAALGATSGAFDNPFFRLSCEERFILSALHLSHWSYRRIARVLKRSEEQVAEIAWSARLQLALAPGRMFLVPHPTGSSKDAPRCPDYNDRRPWTQKFFDDEASTQEKVFIRDHLQHCSVCRQALQSCRKMYYSVGEMIASSCSTEDVDQWSESLKDTYIRTRMFSHPMSMTFMKTVAVFLGRSEVQWFLVILAAALFVALMR